MVVVLVGERASCLGQSIGIVQGGCLVNTNKVMSSRSVNLHISWAGLVL